MSTKVFVYKKACDMRLGFPGLRKLAEKRIEDPWAGHLFTFFNRKADYVKVLWFDGNGFILLSKRLDADLFEVPGVKQITLKKLGEVLGGLNIEGLMSKPIKRKFRKAA